MRARRAGEESPAAAPSPAGGSWPGGQPCLSRTGVTGVWALLRGEARGLVGAPHIAPRRRAGTAPPRPDPLRTGGESPALWLVATPVSDRRQTEGGMRGLGRGAETRCSQHLSPALCAATAAPCAPQARSSEPWTWTTTAKRRRLIRVSGGRSARPRASVGGRLRNEGRGRQARGRTPGGGTRSFVSEALGGGAGQSCPALSLTATTATELRTHRQPGQSLSTYGRGTKLVS